jgi:hypothetical protein
MLRAAGVLALALSAVLAAGCGPGTCDRSDQANPVTPYAEGTVEDGVYASSQPDGELLFFPGGMRYAIEHKLGRTPRMWQIYLSFGRDGTKADALAESSGNQAEVRCVDDETMIIVNGSCVDYWLLVTAFAGDGAGGAPETSQRCLEALNQDAAP